jgi:hypothetical protein
LGYAASGDKNQRCAHNGFLHHCWPPDLVNGDPSF